MADERCIVRACSSSTGDVAIPFGGGKKIDKMFRLITPTLSTP